MPRAGAPPRRPPRAPCHARGNVERGCRRGVVAAALGGLCVGGRAPAYATATGKVGGIGPV